MPPSHQSGSPPQEKRRAPRLPVHLPAHCRLGERHGRQMLADLSLGGFYLRTRDRLKPGTPVRAALALPLLDGLRFCTLTGQVVRVDEQDGEVRGVGVAIAAGLDRWDRELLRGFLALWSSRAPLS